MAGFEVPLVDLKNYKKVYVKVGPGEEPVYPPDFPNPNLDEYEKEKNKMEVPDIGFRDEL